MSLSILSILDLAAIPAFLYRNNSSSNTYRHPVTLNKSSRFQYPLLRQVKALCSIIPSIHSNHPASEAKAPIPMASGLWSHGCACASNAHSYRDFKSTFIMYSTSVTSCISLSVIFVFCLSVWFHFLSFHFFCVFSCTNSWLRLLLLDVFSHATFEISK